MSTTHLSNDVPQGGDMSIILPAGSKMWAESARDGSIFQYADKYFIGWETSQSVLLPDGTTLAESASRPWSFSRVASDTQNSLIATFSAGANPYLIHGVYRYNANSLTNQLVRQWTPAMEQSPRCGPSQRVGLFVDGANATLLTVYADVSGTVGYYAHSVTIAISGNMSIAGILQTTGSLNVGRQNGADVNPRSTAIAGLHMFALAPGVSFADVRLGTDAERMEMLVKPHGKLSEISSGITGRRAFDMCNSAGVRYMDEGVISAGDKLKCRFSGLELTFKQDAGPTALAYRREAFSPLSQRSEARTSAVANQHAVRIGNVVFTGSHYCNGAADLENAIDTRDPLTGYRIAQPMLLPPIYHRELTATGAPVNGGMYYQTPYDAGGNPLIISENHQDLVVATPASKSRLVVKSGRHADRVVFTSPHALNGSTVSDVGGLWDIRDFQLPKPSIINFGDSTAFDRPSSYGCATTDGEEVLVALRGRDTNTGRIRIARVAADGSNTTRMVSAAPNNALDAGYPVDAITTADGTVLACYAVRANNVQGFGAPAVVGFTPAQFESSVTGWWGVRTGENIAPLMPAVPWYQPSLLVVPCPARDAMDLYVANGTLPVAANWAYDVQPSPRCFFQHVDSGREFIGLLCGKHDDPDRNNGTFTPEASGNNREVGLSLYVYWWEPGTKTLHFLREIDLFAAKKRAAAARSGPSTIVGNRDYNWGLSQPLVNRGARAIIAVPRSDGRNYTSDATGWALAGLGTSVGAIDVQDWHLPTYTLDGYGPIIEASEYPGAATLLVRPLDGTTIEMQLTKTGYPGSLLTGAQSSCITRFQNIGFNRLLPGLDRNLNLASA